MAISPCTHAAAVNKNLATWWKISPGVTQRSDEHAELAHCTPAAAVNSPAVPISPCCERRSSRSAVQRRKATAKIVDRGARQPGDLAWPGAAPPWRPQTTDPGSASRLQRPPLTMCPLHRSGPPRSRRSPRAPRSPGVRTGTWRAAALDQLVSFRVKRGAGLLGLIVSTKDRSAFVRGSTENRGRASA